ncbi:hypothetical protein [Streptomyces sp. enrichment culture]|uniref:hypothetical protein n=1 Tax=Streptomyces sp. enrichment culture TaxID=1795815 RepID=UPI003F561F46
MYADGPNLVVRDARCQERRYAVGADGIERAVFFPPQDVWEVAQNRPADRWGVLVFKDNRGRGILHVPLAGWLPEAENIGALDLRPHDCLGRTGLRQLVETLGIPLDESIEPVTVSGVPDDGRGSAPYRPVYAEFPRRRGCVKGLAIFGWFIALVIGIAADLTWVLPVAAGALFFLPAGDAAIRVRAWWHNRQHGRLVKNIEIKPSPAAGSGGTRRFLCTASLCVFPQDVVLTNTLGEERWLGRAGTHGVAGLVRLVDATTGEPLGVEVRDLAGEARALLPWRFWFAGPQGSEGWTALVEALGVPVSDEKYRQPRDAQLWWQDHALAADARKMSPMRGKDARKQSGWHNSVAGTEELLTLPFFSALLLVGIISDETPMILAGWLSALTIALVLGPATVSVLVSRLSLDRTFEAKRASDLDSECSGMFV